ncbi:hypothetical protein F4677DRAFT_330446 [Hypoxylon crocopeplum]|nr:hypothetical protein F4677DRAFT_330446 [Hypoxylon crocopeplum]
MDPSPMDYMSHHSDHHRTPSSSSNTDPATRSACPGLRAVAEQNRQHPSMYSPSRPHYRFDPVPNHPHNNPHFWQGLPPPYARWPVDPAFQPAPPAMPQNTGRVGQPSYPSSNGPNTYHAAHQQNPAHYRAPMPSLQRIGGTAPIQHSQGHFSGSNPGQPQAEFGGGAGAGALSSRTNNSLPSLSSIPPTPDRNLQTPSFTQHSRSAQQQSGRHSPPPFVQQNSGPSTSLSMANVSASVTSSVRNEAGGSQSDSPSPRRVPRSAETTSEGNAAEPRRASTGRSRRALPRLPSSEAGWSSDDDSDHDAVAIELLESIVSGTPVAEERLRAHQLMRGAVSGKRVASRKALTSLESVTISDLPKNERTCVICYNDYGAETPEGISEIPLRLPKCKHVFGDHCIKKWFEESDSCPYCRDKVPSEPQYRHASNAHNVYRFLRQHHQMHLQHMHMRSARENERFDPESLSRPSDAPFGGFAALASSPFADMEFGPFPLGSSGSRRADAISMLSSRPPLWHGNVGERHSPLPFGEMSENRRRVRSRHGSLRGLPQGRPHYAASPANNASQTQQYFWPSRPNPNHSHSRQHSASSSNLAGRATFDANAHPYPFQPQVGAPSEPYLNPLNIASSGGGEDEYRSVVNRQLQQFGALSPTYAGPEVYMSNADDSVFGGPVSRQQL